MQPSTYTEREKKTPRPQSLTLLKRRLRWRRWVWAKLKNACTRIDCSRRSSFSLSPNVITPRAWQIQFSLIIQNRRRQPTTRARFTLWQQISFPQNYILARAHYCLMRGCASFLQRPTKPSIYAALSRRPLGVMCVMLFILETAVNKFHQIPAGPVC